MQLDKITQDKISTQLHFILMVVLAVAVAVVYILVNSLFPELRSSMHQGTESIVEHVRKMKVLCPIPSIIFLSIPLLWFYFVVRRIRPKDHWFFSLFSALCCLVASYFIIFDSIWLSNNYLPPVSVILLLSAVCAICATANMFILKSWTLKAFLMLFVSNISLPIIGINFVR